MTAPVWSLPSTSDAPTDETDDLKPSIDGNDQGTSTVTLATVPTSLLVAGTQEVLGINSLFPDGIIVVIMLAGVANQKWRLTSKNDVKSNENLPVGLFEP